MEFILILLVCGLALFIGFSILSPKNLPKEYNPESRESTNDALVEKIPSHNIPSKYFEEPKYWKDWKDAPIKKTKVPKRRSVPRKKVILDADFELSETGISYFAVFHFHLVKGITDYDIPPTRFEKWPEVLKLGYYVFDEKSKLVFEKYFEFDEENLTYVGKYDEFLADMRKVKVLISHNYYFKEKALKADFLKNGYKLSLFKRQWECLMELTTDVVGIEGNYGKNKWPKLEEMITKLFYPDEDPESYWPEEMGDFQWEVKALAKTFVKLT